MRQLKFSPFKKELLASACDDGSVELWDVQRRFLQHTFSRSHSMSCTSIAFSSVNQMLSCSGGLDKKMIFYDTMDKRAVKQVICPAPLTSLSFYNDGYTIAAGTLYGTILLFDLRNSMEPVNVLKGHSNNSVNSIEFAKPKKTKVPSPSAKLRDPAQSAPIKQPEVDTSNAPRTKWKSIEDIREEAKRNVELRKK